MGQMPYLRLSHNKAKGLTMILHLVFCKQNLPKNFGIALLWNVIWPCYGQKHIVQLLHVSQKWLRNHMSAHQSIPREHTLTDVWLTSLCWLQQGRKSLMSMSAKHGKFIVMHPSADRDIEITCPGVKTQQWVTSDLMISHQCDRQASGSWRSHASSMKLKLCTARMKRIRRGGP